ncbi:hypothetical protein K431DRAFT_299549 [Polychaeton citri CBS 116435]|uniref:Uncharacterized protein n=1 Tax=Polychaeton citri CBS 116435 TaxID=1314669 RepID=A0A9P4URN3_9PEZI|nr:hypothetical protein K431DRAFT_299549 [Polychaeton citri CBS 116435]
MDLRDYTDWNFSYPSKRDLDARLLSLMAPPNLRDLDDDAPWKPLTSAWTDTQKLQRESQEETQSFDQQEQLIQEINLSTRNTQTQIEAAKERVKNQRLKQWEAEVSSGIDRVTDPEKKLHDAFSKTKILQEEAERNFELARYMYKVKRNVILELAPVIRELGKIDGVDEEDAH